MRLPKSEHLILALLSDRTEAYGLELVGASAGRLKRGGIYVTLGRMEVKGLVQSTVGDAGRRLYRLTGLGRRALAAAEFFAGRLKLGLKA